MDRYFVGLFVSRRSFRMPRSYRICAPMPYSRWSGLKPSRSFASHRVEPLVLERVGADLGEQADAPALLAHVEDHAAALLADARERRLELRPAVAPHGVEHVARQALAVRAHEEGLRDRLGARVGRAASRGPC